MNIEQLNKSQIVLLTLLISFVTSIATGIVTVSLMDQAPPVIAQTVNRVIERTIETVVSENQAAASIITRERTVIVKETELISQAVAHASPSVVRLYAEMSDEAAFLGLGIVLSADGSIVSEASVFGEATEVAVALTDGTRVQAFVTSSDETSGFIFLQATSTDDTIVWNPATIGSSSVLGQTVVALSGKSVARVEDGIVTSFIPMSDAPEDGAVIDTNISPDSIIAGSPLINTDGEVVGISTGVSRESTSKGFFAASILVMQPEEETEVTEDENLSTE